MTADFLEKFPGMARMANRLDSSCFLDSRSSSPEDSETSGFSSGSDHLCDVLVCGATCSYILQVGPGPHLFKGQVFFFFCGISCVGDFT